MERQVFVHVDLDGVPHLVGRLWERVRKNKEGATFEYNDASLQHPNRFSLEPALKLGPGPFHTSADMPMFGAIGDSAPDRWGRALMRRMERRRAEHEGQVFRSFAFFVRRRDRVLVYAWPVLFFCDLRAWC